MSNMPNIPMTNPITTARHKVDKKKYDENYDKIFRKKDKPKDKRSK